MNIGWSRKILSCLHRTGVRDVVFCAGARNSPMVAVLARTKGFDLHSYFEERSAAFFALGCARRSGLPVAVVTTSGTAAAELLPATIEAFHTGVPLILITADRPRRLRGTGAPQSIDQTRLFAKFVEREFDLDNGAMFDLAGWTRRRPVHVNLCFEEPLLDEEIAELDVAASPDGEGVCFEGMSEFWNGKESFLGTSPFATGAGFEAAALVARFLRGGGLPLVVVGTLETDREREAVAEFLTRIEAPVYLEGTSGLRERLELRRFSLRAGERILAWALKQGLIARVLRIGGVPTARIWRDLDEADSPVEVLSLSSLPFPGLSRGEMACAEIEATLKKVGAGFSSGRSSPSSDWRCDSKTLQNAERLFVKDREGESVLLRLFSEEPSAEPSLVRTLSERIDKTAFVYVGNSLPIREWDLAATLERERKVEANRGVNGIDGQISSFVGLAREGVENWALLGDLTTLYDLTGPWGLAYRAKADIRLVVINNRGGLIFDRVFKNPLFENRHALDFAAWAAMWSLAYQKWTRIPERFEFERRAQVIEIHPDAEATRRFWNQYDSLWP